MLYIGGPKNPARKLLKMIKNVSKVAEYKINVENSVTFLNINKKKCQEINHRNTAVYSTLKQPKKIVRINLAKEVGELCTSYSL